MYMCPPIMNFSYCFSVDTCVYKQFHQESLKSGTVQWIYYTSLCLHNVFATIKKHCWLTSQDQNIAVSLQKCLLIGKKGTLEILGIFWGFPYVSASVLHVFLLNVALEDHLTVSSSSYSGEPENSELLLFYLFIFFVCLSSVAELAHCQTFP